jgi:colanic acid/amylovoran biosynthesis glycosyltransferase
MIAFSHYGVKDDISGVTSWLFLLIKSLRQRGEPLSLFIQHFGADPHEGSLFQATCEHHIEVNAQPLPPTTSLAVRQTLRHLNQKRPTIFLPQGLPNTHFTAKIAQHFGLPWVFTIHSDDPVYWALADQVGPDKGHGVWVAVSQSIALEARNRFPNADVRVIPYGVSIPEHRAVWNAERFRVVFSGRIVEEQKRVSKVLELFMEACRREPRIEAVFLGDGPDRAFLEQRVKNSGLNDRIKFYGRLPAEKVVMELLSAQATVLLSDYEGLPVSLLEAMAAGVVPVVRNIRSGIPNIVLDDQTGILLGDDLTKNTDALVGLANSPARWAKLSEGARSLVSNQYHLDECHQKWHQLIKELEGKSKIRYPLPIPFFPSLPPLDPRLSFFDQRSFPWKKNIREKIRKAIRMSMRFSPINR